MCSSRFSRLLSSRPGFRCVQKASQNVYLGLKILNTFLPVNGLPHVLHFGKSYILFIIQYILVYILYI